MGADREQENCTMPNAFCSLIGTDIPIVQAAMAEQRRHKWRRSQHAGGLGMLALGWSPPDAMIAEIRATKALTARPFGVNLVLTRPQEDRLAVCLAEGVPVISFFWGQAGSLIAAAHQRRAKVLHTVASAEAARISADDGADAVVAQGWEAGGHVHGTVATLALVPAVVDPRHTGTVLAGPAASPMGAACRGDGVGRRRRVDRDALSRKCRGRDPSSLSRPASSQPRRQTPYSALLFDVGWPGRSAPHPSQQDDRQPWEDRRSAPSAALQRDRGLLRKGAVRSARPTDVE